MGPVWRTAIVTALIACAAGALGVFAGFTYFACGGSRAHASLHAVVHQHLNLDQAQDSRLREIEVRFATRRTLLEGEMRAATRDIAAAVSADESYTPRVQHGIDRFHNATAELQRETIMHVFKMRAVLTPQQQAVFDDAVHRELLRAAGDEQNP